MTYREYLDRQNKIEEQFQAGKLTKRQRSAAAHKLRLEYGGEPPKNAAAQLEKAQRILDQLMGQVRK